MPVVRISDETFTRLQSHAAPFVDTPDAVICRALDALDLKLGVEAAPMAEPQEHVESDPARAVTSGSQLPQKFFRIPLVQTLYALGGRARAQQVREAMEGNIVPQLGSREMRPVSASGNPRWWNATQWNRYHLMKEGLFKSDFEHGVWELTTEGIKYAESLIVNQQAKKVSK